VNRAVFGHVLRQNLLRLVIVVAALAGWGTLMPIIYSAFGIQMQEIVAQFPALEQFMHFGGGDMFTLPGSIAVGFIHPIAIALLAVFAILLPLSGVAGERQRGTLEVILARPVSRIAYYVTLLVASTMFVAIAMAATLLGMLAAATAVNVIDKLDVGNVPALWLNGVLLYFAIATITFAASVSFDRVAPAAGIVGAIVLVAYFLQIIGSLWPDADWLQPYSLFHYLDASATLESGLQVFDVALLAVVGVIAIAYALVVFPRRDLAAPA
jgi:ABC-2 type transport system permease protein